MAHKELTPELKKDILAEILKCDDFVNSRKYRDLLTYLVEASERGDYVKESTIACDFFKKEAFDPSMDSTVRAYISNLRKKLEHYYLTKGHDNAFQLILPKGHYHVEFIKNPRLSGNGQTFKPNLSLILASVLVVLLAVILMMWTSNPDACYDEKRFISADNPVWREILNNEKPVLLILGDYYFFNMHLMPEHTTYIRDIAINSNQDLDQFLKEHPEHRSKVDETFNSYLDEHSPMCVSYIVPALVLNGKDYEIKLSSEVQLDDIQENNVIYIGPHKCLYALENITKHLNFKYSINPRQIEFFEKDSNRTITYSWPDVSTVPARSDFAVVSKLFGPNDNIFLFFISIHDIGNTATVKTFTDPEKLVLFEQKLNAQYFEALFEVQGIVRTDFNTNLLHLNTLGAEFKM